MESKECEHEFGYIKGSAFELSGMGETLEREVKCFHCGLKAREVWIYSCTLDKNNKEV